VRLDLEPQRVKLGARELGLQPRFAQGEPLRASMRRQRAADDEEQDVGERIDREIRRRLPDQGTGEAVGLDRCERLRPDRQLRGNRDVRRHQRQAHQDEAKRHTPSGPAAGGGGRAAPQHQRRHESPVAPRAQLPDEDAVKRVSVPEHRQVGLRRHGQRQDRGGANTDRGHQPRRNGVRILRDVIRCYVVSGFSRTSVGRTGVPRVHDLSIETRIAHAPTVQGTVYPWP
jgi:hypothetical protein